MIRKLFILGLVVAACLQLTQGKPNSRAKIMEDYAEAIIQEAINQSFEELASAQKGKDCTGRFIGERTHMHNCKGKCCSKNRDGSSGYKCDQRSQNYCGYCFTG